MSDCTPIAFRGTFDHRLDAKGRVAIPAEWRPSGSLDLILRTAARSEMEVLRFYTQEKMNSLIKQIEDDEEFSEAEKRTFIGNINESSTNVSINSQGKLLIPKKFIEENQLKTDVALVGRGGEFEIMDPAVHAVIKSREASKLSKLNEKYGI